MAERGVGCRFTTAIVLCDQSWVDPDLDDTNGIQVREQRDMLRLESQILLVQLHIRKSLMVCVILCILSTIMLHLAFHEDKEARGFPLRSTACAGVCFCMQQQACVQVATI